MPLPKHVIDKIYDRDWKPEDTAKQKASPVIPPLLRGGDFSVSADKKKNTTVQGLTERDKPAKKPKA